MDVLSLFAVTVFAFEGIISPLPDDGQIGKPTVSFESITSPVVLGETTAVVPTPILTPITPTPLPTIAESPTPTRYESRSARKNAMTIALIGDSMVDTLGPDFPALKSLLATSYPKTQFTILNFGVGGTNIDYGLERLTHGYTYLDKPYPSLVSRQPDLVVIESFGYNPYSFDEGALDRHWLARAQAVDIIKSQVPSAKIIIAATIAPNNTVFGDGVPFLNFDSAGKKRRVGIIDSYLDSTVRFAQSQHLPLADAYHLSMDASGNGKIQYINPGDHIHYSDEGRAFFAKILLNTIISNKLLE